MLGIYTAQERQRQLETGSYEPIEEDEEISEAESLRDHAPRHRRSSRRTPAVVEPVETRTQGAHTSAELMEAITGTAVDSPLCFTCGTKMRPAGSCYVCEGCGATSGCS